MTYGDLTREQVDRLVDDPVYMARLEENYNAKMAQFQKDVDADLARIIKAEYGL